MDQYDAEGMGHCRYLARNLAGISSGATLGFFWKTGLRCVCLNRHDEATVQLHKGGTHQREMREAITHARYAKPRDSDVDRVIMGGRYEAWLYRQDMQSTWRSEGAIAWLKQQPMAP
jgi:hypothetical protein